MNNNEAKLMILHSDNSAESYYLALEVDMAQIQCLLNMHKKITRKPIHAIFIQKPDRPPVEVTSLYDIRLSNV